jgi:hypothetical protein
VASTDSLTCPVSRLYFGVKTPGNRGRAPRAAFPSWLAIGLLALAALLSCFPFIAPGHPSSVDVWPHLARQSIVYHAIKAGFSPFYTFMFYCGFPALRFYSPLFYFLGGPATLLTGGNLLHALRILLVVLHLLSAPAMYLLLRKLEDRKKAREAGGSFGPALGAIAYLVIPWRTLYLSGLANYPQALVYVLLPLALLAVEAMLEHHDGAAPPWLRSGLLLGLWVGMLFLAHLVYAIFMLGFLAVWWLARSSRAPHRWRALTAAVLSGIGVSAFFVIPFLLEQPSHRSPIVHLALPVPNWRVLLGIKSRVGGYAGTYLGLSIVLLLVVAVGAVLLRRRFRSHVPALLGLAGSLFLTFAPALLGEKQYLLTTGLPPERFLVFVVFFAAVLLPAAYRLLQPALARIRFGPSAAFAVMAGAVMLDCLWPVLHFTYPDRSEILAVREEIYPIVAGEPHARLLDLNAPEGRIDDVRRTCRFPTVGVIYGGLPSPLGLPYHQYAPASMLHVYPWVEHVALDIGAGNGQPISDDTHKALALMGVSHLITLPALVRLNDNAPVQLLLKQVMDWDDRFVVAEREPPLALGRTFEGVVLAANRTTPMPPDTLMPDHTFIVARNWRPLLESLRLDQAANRLSFIPTAAGTRPESLPGRPALEIDSTRIRHPDVLTGFRVTADCFLRVAVSYYPELEVRLDNRPVRYFETADHFIYIRCPAGAHRLHVSARLGGLRIVTLFLSLASVLAVVVLLLRPRAPGLPHP